MPETSRRSVLLPVALATLAGLTGSAPAAELPIRLIARGDDMGSSQASNEAAIRCFEAGVMRDVEVMAVGPWFPQAARLLHDQGVTDAWTSPAARDVVRRRGIELIGYKDLVTGPGRAARQRGRGSHEDRVD